MTPKLSVLIPVYKVESYIERCVHSLMKQTFQDVEFIFVDDCSPDNSVTLLEAVVELYPERKSQVLLLHHEQNLGLAAARNTAFAVAHGEYIICCDSDDWIEPDYCMSLVEIADREHSDLVVCDFFKEYKDCSVRYFFQEFTDYQQLIDNSNSYPWNVFCRLVSRSLLIDNNLYWYDGINMAEDVGLMVRAHYYSKRTVYLHKPLYHYNCVNPTSYLHLNCDPKSDKQYEYVRELLSCLDKLSEFFRLRHISPNVFCLKYRKDIVGTVILTQHFEILDSSYHAVIPSLMRRSDLPLAYRFVLSFALLGIPLPLKIYVCLSYLIHNRS